MNYFGLALIIGSLLALAIVFPVIIIVYILLVGVFFTKI